MRAAANLIGRSASRRSVQLGLFDGAEALWGKKALWGAPPARSRPLVGNRSRRRVRAAAGPRPRPRNRQVPGQLDLFSMPAGPKAKLTSQAVANSKVSGRSSGAGSLDLVRAQQQPRLRFASKPTALDRVRSQQPIGGGLRFPASAPAPASRRSSGGAGIRSRLWGGTKKTMRAGFKTAAFGAGAGAGVAWAATRGGDTQRSSIYGPPGNTGEFY